MSDAQGRFVLTDKLSHFEYDACYMLIKVKNATSIIRLKEASSFFLFEKIIRNS